MQRSKWIGTSTEDAVDSLNPAPAALDSDTGITVVVTPGSPFFKRGLDVVVLGVRCGRFSSLAVLV